MVTYKPNSNNLGKIINSMISDIKYHGFEKLDRCISDSIREKSDLERTVYELELELNSLNMESKMIDKNNNFLLQENNKLNFQSTRISMEQLFMNEEIPLNKREIESVYIIYNNCYFSLKKKLWQC